MSENLKKGFRNILIYLLTLIFITGLLPASATTNILSDITSPSDAAELLRQELNQNKAELKQELENEGYEVSEENLKRYIDTFINSYQNGLKYIINNQDRLILAMQDAVAAGYSTSQLDQLNEKLISQMMLESGFNPNKIAQNIFPKKSTIPTEKKHTAPIIETPKTSSSTPEIIENKPASKTDSATSPPTSDDDVPAPIQNMEKNISSNLKSEDMKNKKETYFTSTDDSFFTSINNSIRSWAFDKKKASDTRKRIFDPDENAETASDIIINLTSKVAGTVGSVGVAVVDTYYDFIDNLADGDSIMLGGSKSLIANTANGLAGIFIGSADIIAYTFSRIPFVQKEFPTLPDRLDFGKNIKGPINFAIDNIFNGENLADMRAVSGAYGINIKDSFKNRKIRPTMPSKHEIISHNQKYNQSKNYGVNIVRY